MTEINKINAPKNVISSNLLLGQYLDIEIEGEPGKRFTCNFLGVKDGHYIIIDEPNQAKYRANFEKLKKDQSLILRTICEGTSGECMAFRSTILEMLPLPLKILFVSFPSGIETYQPRKEKRQDVHLPVILYKVPNKKHIFIEGTIIDISDGGCRIEFHDNKAILPLQAGKLYIEYENPLSGEKIERFASICSKRKTHGKISFGFSFILQA